MPIFSLASEGGIGTFGKEAYRFVDFLKASKQSYWQILPLTPTGHGDSPYSSFSAFAGNPYFIDLEVLIDENLLTKKNFQPLISAMIHIRLIMKKSAVTGFSYYVLPLIVLKATANMTAF